MSVFSTDKEAKYDENDALSAHVKMSRAPSKKPSWDKRADDACIDKLQIETQTIVRGVSTGTRTNFPLVI